MKSEMSNNIVAWSALGTAVIAFIALIVAICQLTTSNDAQREATANDTYKDYLKLAIDNPILASGLTQIPEDPKIREQYSWFVSYFLHSAEQIFLISPDDDEWRAAISNQVCFHQAFLKTDEYNQNLKLHYDEDFRKLVDEALKVCH